LVVDITAYTLTKKITMELTKKDREYVFEFMKQYTTNKSDDRFKDTLAEMAWQYYTNHDFTKNYNYYNNRNKI